MISFCCLTSAAYLWFGDNYAILLLWIAFVIVVILGLIKLNEFISEMVKLNSSLTKLRNKQQTTERTIEKISAKTHQLESKLTKINSYGKTQHKELEPNNQDQLTFENPIPADQLELDISETYRKLSDDSLSEDFMNWDLLLKALHFPNDANDTIGFEALNIARKDNLVLELLRVSEDFLNLLAHDGIYLDDLTVEAPSVEAWRNFINTDKKVSYKKLSCIGIDESIKKLKIRAKMDAVFRDTALMLFRRFDKLLRDRAETAEDHQIFKISATRSGKAFLIVGKISDIF